MHSLEIDECGADALSNFFPKKYAAAVPFAAALYLVKNRDMNGTALNEALERTVLMFSRRLNACLDMLSLLANIAPLCGLLGTVTGLMAAFDQMEQLK